MEFLVWVYERFCASAANNQQFTMADLFAFNPATAPQGRQKFKPSEHRYSVACKILRDELQRDPSHDEVMMFIRRNPDVGVNLAKERAEIEQTKRGILQRGPLPSAVIEKKKKDDGDDSDQSLQPPA
jgi:hypothetical protein